MDKIKSTIRRHRSYGDKPSVMDDPFGLITYESTITDGVRSVISLGQSTPSRAFQVIKTSIADFSTIKQVIKRRMPNAKLSYSEPADQAIITSCLISSQAFREVAQEQVYEAMSKSVLRSKSTEGERKKLLEGLVEYYWINEWVKRSPSSSRSEPASQAPGTHEGCKTQDLNDSKEHRSHSSKSLAVSMAHSLFSMRDITLFESDRVTINPLLEGLSDEISIVLHDAVDAHRLNEDDAVVHAYAMLGVASLFRSVMLIAVFANTWCRPSLVDGIEGVIDEGVSDINSIVGYMPYGKPEQSATLYQLMLYFNQILSGYNASGVDGIDDVVNRWPSHKKQMLSKSREIIYNDTKSDLIALRERIRELIGADSDPLEVRDKLIALEKHIESVESLVQKEADIDEAVLGHRGSDALCRDIQHRLITPGNRTLSKLKLIIQIAQDADQNKDLSLREKRDRMDEALNRYEEWERTDGNVVTIQPVFDRFHYTFSEDRNDPRDNQAAGSAEEKAPTNELSSPVHDAVSTLTEEDLAVIDQERKEAVEEKKRLSCQVEALQNALNSQSASSQETLQAAFTQYQESGRVADALTFTEKLYSDRVRFLPNVWDSLSQNAEALRTDVVLDKLLSLINQGLDAFRDGTQHIKINDIIRGELKLNESESVRKNAKQRRMRQFNDGDSYWDMQKHVAIDYSNRLYFEYSVDEDRIVVGYIGKHLPGARHSTV